MRVVHRLAAEWRPMLRRTLTARWKVPVVAFAEIEVMIHVPVKMFRPVKPRSRAQEHSS